MFLSRSPRRSKHGHEKNGKHGKKVDPYLEPLRQRWICYECGKIRSDKIRERHPLAVDEKMQPNWCGRCRITHEHNGKPLAWYGQRHYCWGCGIVRSEKYHRENELAPGRSSGPNYCKPCREASPGYEHNLREASEVGGETTNLDKAFMRQVHDANLSDIEEDKDDHASTSNRAPGKENDARAGLLKSREATSSMLKNRSFKTKTDSDTSSEGNVTIKKLKEMHLEADKTLNSGGKAGDGGARLSAGYSYKPPSVESASGCSSTVGGDVKTYRVSHCDTGNLAPAGGDGDREMKDAIFYTADKACQADISSTIRVYPSGPDTVASPMDVHQSDSGSRPTTCERDGLAVDENIGDKIRLGKEPLEPFTSPAHLNPDLYTMNHRAWAAQSSAPKAYDHIMSPPIPAGYGAHCGAGGSDPGTGAQYTTQPSCFSRPQNGFNSAAHFSDAHCRRDFSGDSYHDHANEDQYGYSRPSYPGGGFAQTQQNYHYGHQDAYGTQCQYGPQSQYGAQGQTGFKGQPGSWTDHNGHGFSQQGPAFEDSGYSAPKEFDFSFLGRANGGSAADSASDNYVPTQEEINAYTQRNCMGPQTKATTPRAEPQWTIYEDDDAARNQQQWGDPAVGAYAWRDGKTSVHHVSSSTPGNTVTILSIREITSDEDLSAKCDGDRDDDGDGMFLKSRHRC
ncbi:putative oligosaccharyl transferase stt3 subunit [Diaporthe ampelina]|uniref:Putative oligosaccharyl transferase stt3 subunit n=1 Tax=Diaporthe ampelina TaxID=1214573 RepID=A0A0G2FBX0_9PEZI|nr:putative oligosaccharyl transferase stt3 subunit [Diaporthe ampelina]